MRTVLSTTVGAPMPVTVDLKVEPLTSSSSGKREVVKNGNGRVIMNDEWIYVNIPRYGSKSINVNRANYCHKVYLMNTLIIDSVCGAIVTPALQRFINKVSDKLVFEKDGVAYRVFLINTKKGFDLSHVRPYWAEVHGAGYWNYVIKKYGSHPGCDYKKNEDGSRGEHKLNVNLNDKFGFNYVA